MRLNWCILFCISLSSTAHSQGLSIILIQHSSTGQILLEGWPEDTSAQNQYQTRTDNSDSMVVFLSSAYRFHLPIDSDSVLRSKNSTVVELDSASISGLLKSDSLIINLTSWGMESPHQSGKLIHEYGLKYVSGGCTPYYLQELAHIEERKNELLYLRNGSGWQKRYNRDRQRRKFK